MEQKLSPNMPLTTLIDVLKNTQVDHIPDHETAHMTHDEIDTEYGKRSLAVYTLRKEALACIIQNYQHMNPYERMETTESIFNGITPTRSGSKFASITKFCFKNPNTPPEFFHVIYLNLLDHVKNHLNVYNTTEWVTKYYIRLFAHPNCAVETLTEGFLTEQDRAPIHLAYLQATKECTLQEKFLLDFSLQVVENIVGNLNCPVEIWEWASTHAEWKIQRALAANIAAPDEYRVLAGMRLLSFTSWDED